MFLVKCISAFNCFTRLKSLLILQLLGAIFNFQKRGVDGVASLTENGVARDYGTGGYPRRYIAQITPIARRVK